MVGEPRSPFDAGHQLCGTHQLSRYVEHAVATELRVREDYCSGARRLRGARGPHRLTDAPLPYAGEWRDHFERCCSANDGHAAAASATTTARPCGEAAAARSGRRRRRLQGGRLGRRRVLGPGGDARAVLVKPPGGAQAEIPRPPWRLGGGGPRSRRGAHVAEQQTVARPGVRHCVEIPPQELGYLRRVCWGARNLLTG